MDSRIQTLLKYGDQLFTKRQSLLSLWQEQAEQFYPERADFTTQRNLGYDFAANLVTSYPLIARRDLGNTFSSMLRPVDQPWFGVSVMREDKIDNEAKRWLEWATTLQRRAMYDRVTKFDRATKEGDHDFAAFGQCVLSVELNRNADALLYRCWHLRDVVWSESYDGKVTPVHRKWLPTAWELDKVFKGKISDAAQKQLKDDPFGTVNVRHVVIRADDYESPSGKKWKTPYVSIYFEADGGFINEELGTHNPMYVIPRWQTVSGSQYGYSPATVAALPDARLIQAMTLTLLEAGEKAANPPMVATSEAIRSDINLFAGGITHVDMEYDERMGEALRPLKLDNRGLPMGMDMRKETQEMIAEAFFLNKISLPPTDNKEMTAYETSQRIQEYIRNALPLFEPMEVEYNGGLCEATFNVLMRAGAFGNPQDIPQSIRGADIQFTFESPLHKAIEKQKGATFQEARTYLAEAIALDPSSAQMMDVRAALRDVLDGIGTPAKWVRTEQQMQQMDVEAQQRQHIQDALGMITQGANAAEQVGKAGQALTPVVSQQQPAQVQPQ